MKEFIRLADLQFRFAVFRRYRAAAAAVLCQLVPFRRRCRAAPALRAASGRLSPLRYGWMRFLFIG